MTLDELYSTLHLRDVSVKQEGNKIVIGSSEYVPMPEPVNGFTITLYKNKADTHRVDKSSYLTVVGELNGALRSGTNLVSPSILIYYEGLPNFNYVYLSPFKRYYYVSSVDIVRTNLYEIFLDVDVLMTYREGIKKLDAFVVRNEHTYNDFLVDDRRVIEQGYDVDVYTLQNDIFDIDAGGEENGSFVISGFAIGTEANPDYNAPTETTEEGDT